MARITYGALITNIAGSIGGVTFQCNSSGAIAKLRSRSNKSSTPDQVARHSVLANLVSLWSTLSAVQQTAWNAIAAANVHISPWGESKQLNGYQWFISCNSNNILCGYAIILAAPAYASIAPPNTFSLGISATNFNINIATGWNPGTDKILIYASPPMRQTSINLRRNLLLLTSYTGGNINQYNIRAAYVAKFNIIWADFYNVPGHSIYIRARQIQTDTGMSSSFKSKIYKL